MKGENELILNTNEVIIALQEYLNKRWPKDTPEVYEIEHDDEEDYFVLKLREKTDYFGGPSDEVSIKATS